MNGVGQPQVDLRLAAAGHAVNQGDVKGLRCRQRQQLIERALLFLGGLANGVRPDCRHRVFERIAIDAIVAERHQSQRSEPRQRGAADAALP